MQIFTVGSLLCRERSGETGSRQTASRTNQLPISDRLDRSDEADKYLGKMQIALNENGMEPKGNGKVCVQSGTGGKVLDYSPSGPAGSCGLACREYCIRNQSYLQNDANHKIETPNMFVVLLIISPSLESWTLRQSPGGSAAGLSPC